MQEELRKVQGNGIRENVFVGVGGFFRVQIQVGGSLEYVGVNLFLDSVIVEEIFELDFQLY